MGRLFLLWLQQEIQDLMLDDWLQRARKTQVTAVSKTQQLHLSGSRFESLKQGMDGHHGIGVRHQYQGGALDLFQKITGTFLGVIVLNINVAMSRCDDSFVPLAYRGNCLGLFNAGGAPLVEVSPMLGNGSIGCLQRAHHVTGVERGPV